MAQLIWKGKSQARTFICAGEQELTGSDASDIPRLITTESHFLQNPQTPTDLSSPDHPWYNRLIFGDKLHVLPALLPEFAGKVNLIYIDPPFMTGRDFKNGKQLAYSDKWDNNLDLYIQWLYEAFVALHLLLAPTGSLYVHLDWRVTHYAKVLLDEVFGFSPSADGPGFKNEIIWHYQSGGRTRKRFARKHDTILFYTKSAHYCFHAERISERRGAEKRNHMRKEVDAAGRVYWTIKAGGRIYTYDEDSLMTPPDVWSDISHLHQKDPERNGYATQKPAALVERIILASSEEQDLVLDCFCGSGVTPVVAQQLGRRWIACDQGELAISMTRARLLSGETIVPFVLQRPTNSSR
ncbi:MAG TPA: site-specific DNA-methyltransferase [Ktedonobacteraceae bacterium]|nr:site-specific DNA-methyltransferase [Ktedonobacteraceae bacterium]